MHLQESRIKLDIGGHNYTTSITTLRGDPDSMLAAMFSGRHELKKEPDGSYFIDRDGIHFRHILNFLRDGQVEAETLPKDPITLKELLREAKYYQLANMVVYLEETLQNNGKWLGCEETVIWYLTLKSDIKWYYFYINKDVLLTIHMSRDCPFPLCTRSVAKALRP